MDLKEQAKAPAEEEGGTGSYVPNPGFASGVAPYERSERPISVGVDIGHVHLRAGDLAKIKAFYVGILGFDVMMEGPTMLFLAAGGYHHHLGFNTWESKGGSPPPPGTTGLYHVAIRYPTRAALGDALTVGRPCPARAARRTPKAGGRAGAAAWPSTPAP